MILSIVAVSAASAVPVYIDDISADASTTVSVPVMITGAPTIGSFDIVITYDPAVLGSPIVSDGTLTAGVAGGTGTSGQVSLAYASASGFSGTGSIAVIDFTVLGSSGDTSNLAFTSATATEPMFTAVTLTTTDGIFTVNGGGTVSTGAVRALSATSVYAGSYVDVTVSVDPSVYGAFGALVETIPSGLSYVSSTPDATQVGNELRFILTGENTVAYRLYAHSTGTYPFSGTMLDESKVTSAVTGDASLSVRSSGGGGFGGSSLVSALDARKPGDTTSDTTTGEPTTEPTKTTGEPTTEPIKTTEPTKTAEPTTTDDAGDGAEDTPGFGVLLAVSGLSMVAYRLKREQ